MISSRATYFGHRERPLFGWLHAPRAALASIGLVICAPFGYEAVCSHRSMRHFADAAAEAGIPALRFDYDGTGDSAGIDLGPKRLDAWLGSIHAAIDELQRQTGVTRVCLLGIRLGATLAALALQQRQDVVGVACLVPITKTRSYLRELRALAFARPQAERQSEREDPDFIESAGFSMSGETCSELAAVDVSGLKRWPEHVLIIERDDMPSHDAWLDSLRTGARQVSHHRLPGYVEMMLDSHESVVPRQMLETSTRWLRDVSQTFPALPLTFATSEAVAAAEFSAEDAGSQQVIESAEYLDPQRCGFGIVSATAATRAQSAPAPLILLLNSGAVPHIGPNRLYVRLARRWAAAGAIVARIDLSGIGDSNTRAGQPENIVYSKHAHDDIVAAIATLFSRYPCGDVHAVGLCSGAYHSFRSAVEGIEFRSIVAINPLTFAWREGISLAYPQHRVSSDIIRYRTNAFQWASWKKLLSGGVNLRELTLVLMQRAITVANSNLRNLVRGIGVPLPNDLGTQLLKLGARQVELLFVFAAGEPGIDLLNVNGGSAVARLSRRGQLQIHTIDGADHTFTSSWTREQLANTLTEHIHRWLSKSAR